MYDEMTTLFGYGHPAARVWVVGMEEHCGDDEEVQLRIDARLADQRAFLDRVQFHEEIEVDPGEVHVWSNARKIYLGLFGIDTDLGREDPNISDVLLAELLPLPRSQHSDRHWPTPYREYFADVPSYKAAAIPAMSARLFAMVREHTPALVILHGKAGHRSWIRCHPVLRGGWIEECLDRTPKGRRVLVRLRRDGPTTWVLCDNLTNNGYINWTADRIDSLVTKIGNLDA